MVVDPVDTSDPFQSILLSLELARWAIDAYLSLLHSTRKTTLEVHFFGGEPFNAFETVFFAVEYARLQANQQGLEARFEVITMAPLLLIMLLVGLYPAPVLNMINATVTALLAGL